MSIFLIGLPGSGKSFWGEKLADKLSVNFIDLDNEIERKAGSSIIEIFRLHGEEYFRLIEKEVLESVIALHKNEVIACGGGTPCFYNNIEMMNRSGKTIYLKTPISLLLERLKKSSESAKRPLFDREQSHQTRLTTLLQFKKAIL